jgi:peptidyl-prolyl cis-trans isomerase-like protein 2
LIDEDVLRYERVKKKGYVRINTNKGALNVELHCDMVPKTCENFLKLCAQGYYDGTIFHRSIRNFIVTLVLFLSFFSFFVSRHL